MPFALKHKPSKGRLRRNSPSPLDLTTTNDPMYPSTGIPTPPLSGNSAGFKMFWQKKKPQTVAMPFYPDEAPRPILKKSSVLGSPTGIRFEDSLGNQTSTPPLRTMSVVQTPPVIDTPGIHRPNSPNGLYGTKKSSRPTSPSASSFGTRIRTSQCSISSTLTMQQQNLPISNRPLSTHITTPPSAFIPTFQERAPPPPSPVRQTFERSRHSTTFFPRPLPNLHTSSDAVLTNRPPRHSSLFRTDSMSTLNDQMVPMLNIIPATPQDNNDGFQPISPLPDRQGPKPKTSMSLQESISIEEMDEIPLDLPRSIQELPSIDINLDFSPFAPLADLPDIENEPQYFGRMELPPSPPFESFPSLPSLDSQGSVSIQSSESQSSITLSLCCSNTSLSSLQDVEQVLGSMLASLSETNIPEMSCEKQINHGLGLGLGLELTEMRSSTAPLSPKKRPDPLDLSKVKSSREQGIKSAPPCINHRIAFYKTAKIAPNSPCSGFFFSNDGSSLALDLALADLGDPVNDDQKVRQRDSISLKSEASDDDLHTASIISLTPVIGDRAGIVEMREEVSLACHVDVEVGLAL